MPLFSILIPLRNRVHLLKYVIQSVLNQYYDDYELIVSDNDSSDDTTLGFDSQKTCHVNRISIRSVRRECFADTIANEIIWRN